MKQPIHNKNKEPILDSIESTIHKLTAQLAELTKNASRVTQEKAESLRATLQASIDSLTQPHKVPQADTLVYCDLCNSIIPEVRWKCLVCPDYDVCENCKHNDQLLPHHHPLAAMPTPSAHQEPGGSDTVVVCDGCSSIINGIRYKCTKCDNIDFCSTCRQSAEQVHKQILGSSHNLAAVYNVDTDAVVYDEEGYKTMVVCDSCGIKVQGTRY
ncbi:hypothetical protein BB559_005559, partial [Furculomyces boomerangus]